MKCCLKLLLIASATALQPPQKWKALAKKALAPALLSAGCLSSTFAPPANAADKRQIASITASGLVFKDKLIVDAFADPKVEGVTLYVSDFERPVVERVQKDFFSDPSQSGLACSRRGAPLKVGNVDTSAEGEDVVSEAKSLLFKTLRVRGRCPSERRVDGVRVPHTQVKRIVDKEANALVYVSYSTRTRLCGNHNLWHDRVTSTRLTR